MEDLHELRIGGLTEGVVIDHIHAGGAMEIYNYLNLEKLDASVAIIKNVRSSKMGKKDIIKCKNPRCITSVEQELPHKFKLTDHENRVYRCMYCEQRWHRRRS